MSLFNDASIIITPNGVKAGKLYALKGADLDVVRATSATRVNASGLIELVGANVPRLDYSNGSCPSILVEPQRTNLVYPSSDFSTIWSLYNSATITTNQATAPDGTLTADKITTVNSANALYNVNGSGTTAADYTVSLFIKPINNNSVGLGMTNDTTGEAFVLINLQTGSGTLTQQSGWSNASYKWDEYENGWYMVSVTATKGASGNARFILKGNASSEYYIWGAQLEAGSYQTSYIPTTSASVTRNADVISKTGISSLLPQQTGTMFVEFDWQKTFNDTQVISISNNSNNLVWILKENNTTLNATFFMGGFIGTINYTLPSNSQTIKAVYSWANNDQVLYVNGVQAGTASGAITSSPNNSLLEFNAFWNILKNGTYIKAAALWTTRLTNTQLAQLTTI